MIRILSLAAIITFLLTACKSKEQKAAEQYLKEIDKAMKSFPQEEKSSPVTKMDEMEKTLEELKKMPALTTEQLKALLPQELLGMKRSGFSANSMMGYGMAEATYKSDDNKQLRLTIHDVAGEAGSAWYSMMFWGFNMEREDDNGYEKTITYNGAKAIEKYQKYNEKYSLMYFTGNRLLVQVEGEKTGLDAVKAAAGSLNLNIH
jgi:hypothetical protein